MAQRASRRVVISIPDKMLPALRLEAQKMNLSLDAYIQAVLSTDMDSPARRVALAAIHRKEV